MVAGLLVDAGWGCRQLVVEAIKQDAFSSCNEALHVRASEVEVPDLRIFPLVIRSVTGRKLSVCPNEIANAPRRKARINLALDKKGLIEATALLREIAPECSDGYTAYKWVYDGAPTLEQAR